MGEDDGPDQTQTKPQPALGSTLVAPVQPVPDMRQVVRRDADARIGDVNADERAFAPCTNRDSPA